MSISLRDISMNAPISHTRPVLCEHSHNVAAIFFNTNMPNLKHTIINAKDHMQIFDSDIRRCSVLLIILWHYVLLALPPMASSHPHSLAHRHKRFYE